VTANSLIESDRSFERIADDDLAKLQDIALHDSEQFLCCHPRYKASIICIALCQGAALHYVDARNGVKDFDVWTFYAKSDVPAFPVRRLQRRDFGKSRFGRHPGDTGFLGRQVHLLGRSIEDRQDPVSSIQSYLAQGRTHTAIELSRKVVVLLWPADLRGTVVWPASAVAEADR
jgi:hypothetical protein